jgi:hypothetical protein
VVVRGEDYISVIDPQTFKETRRIQTAVGPGMVQFLPDNKLASRYRASRRRWM